MSTGSDSSVASLTVRRRRRHRRSFLARLRERAPPNVPQAVGLPAEPAFSAQVAATLRVSLSLMLGEAVSFLLLPLITLGLVLRGVDVVTAGTLAAIPAVGLLLGIPFVPRMIKMLGAKRAFILGAVLRLVSLAGYSAAVGHGAIAFWIVAGLVEGVSQALRWIVADTVVASISTRSSRGKLMSLHETIRSSAIGVGPGAVALVSGDLVFGLACAAVLSAFALVTSFWIPTPTASTERIAVAARPFRLPVLPPAAFIALLGGLTESATSGSVPVYAFAFGLGAAASAALASVAGFGNIVSQMPIGWAMDRLGVGRTRTIVAMLAVAVTVALPLCIGSGMIMPMMLVFGGLSGAYYTISIVATTEAAGDMAKAVATVAVLYTIGTGLGPVLGNASLVASTAWGLPLLLAGASVAVLTVRMATR